MSATDFRASDIYPPGFHGHVRKGSGATGSQMSAAPKKPSDISRERASTRVGVRVPDSLLADLDARAAQAGMNRSDFIRTLIALPLDIKIGTRGSAADGHEVQAITDSDLLGIRDELDEIAGLYARCAKSLTLINRKFASRSTMPDDVRVGLADSLELLMKRIATIKTHVQGIESSLDALARKPTARLASDGRQVAVFTPAVVTPRINKNERQDESPAAVNPEPAAGGRGVPTRLVQRGDARIFRSEIPSESQPEFTRRRVPPTGRAQRHAAESASRKRYDGYGRIDNSLGSEPEDGVEDLIADSSTGDLDAIMNAKNEEARLCRDERDRQRRFGY